MTDTERTAYLNSLPNSHWKAWYADEHRMSDLISKQVATGLCVEDAYDAAIAEFKAIVTPNREGA